MGAERIVWHVGFGWRLRRHGPRDLQILQEFALAEEALRIDFLILRKYADSPVEDAQTLRKLWPLLPRISVVEYKGPKRPLRAGDLDKLWAYVHLFVSDPRNEVVRRDDVCAVLAVPHRTPTLNNAVRDAKLTWEDLGDGYFRVHGGQFVLYVVELDVVGRQEPDGILYGLATAIPTTAQSYRFIAELLGSKEIQLANRMLMEGAEELQQALFQYVPREEVVTWLNADERLAGLAPEQRLAGLAPEQRLAGLDHDRQALALPLDVLRLLPAEYFQSLSPDVRAILEDRLAKP